MLREKHLSLLFLFMFFILANCTSIQGRFVALDNQYPPYGIDCSVDIFKNEMPSRDFVEISRIDVHLEKTLLITTDFDGALPELQKQACLSGADAVVNIQERSSTHLETNMYHVTATGVRYK